MKFCALCGDEISTKDGENLRQKCDDNAAAIDNRKRRRARIQRLQREARMADLGMVKVRGALGGVYWE